MYLASRMLDDRETAGEISFLIILADEENKAVSQAGYTSDDSRVFFDGKPPTLVRVSIHSDNALEGNAAIPGDTVELNFTANELLGAGWPKVSIHGSGATVTKIGENAYAASREMRNSDTEGLVTFSIDTSDRAGNVGTQATTVTDASTITFDKTPPTLTTVSISSDNIRGNYAGEYSTGTSDFQNNVLLDTLISAASDISRLSFARPGHTVTIDLIADELLSPKLPIVTIGGRAAAVRRTGMLTYKARRLLDTEDIEGPVAFGIDYADAFGNRGVRVTSTTNSSRLTVDKTPPVLSRISIYSDNEHDGGAAENNPMPTDFPNQESAEHISSFFLTAPRHSFVRFGHQVTVEFAANEPLAASMPVVTIAGGPASVAKDKDNVYRATRVLTSGNNEGPIFFAINFSDVAGNAGAEAKTVTDNSTVSYDETPPELRKVSISSNNVNDEYARAGQLVSVGFSSNELLSHLLPRVSIGGKPATVIISANYSFLATRVMQPGDAEGVVPFTIEYSDAAGNAGVRVSAATDESIVTFDVTPPRLARVSISSNNPHDRETSGADAGFPVSQRSSSKAALSSAPRDNGYVKYGQIVSIGFLANEPLLSALPKVTIDRNFAEVSKVEDNLYVATRVMEQGDTEGEVAFTIEVADLAGNIGDQVTGVTDGTSVTYDETPPLLRRVSIFSDNERSGYAKAGHRVSVDFDANEVLAATLPEVTIDGKSVEVLNTGGNAYHATHLLQETDTEGPVSFVIHFMDAAGNLGTVVSSPTDNSSVIHDKTPPGLPKVTIFSNNLRKRYAKAGDAVSVEFTTDELLGYAWPQVTIAADTVKAHQIAENKYRATRVLQAGETEGVVSFAIDYSDAAGNAGVRITSVTDSSHVTFDSTTPKLTYVSISSDNERGDLARPGNNVSIVFAVDEFLGPSLPAVTIDRRPVSVSASEGNVYQAGRTLQQGDTEGEVSFTIDFTDLAGNIGEQVTGVTDGTNVTYDETPPLLPRVSISSDNERSSYAKAGHRVSLDFDANEVLASALPEVAIDGKSVKVLNTGGNAYRATHLLQETDTEGPVSFVIHFMDAAGNLGTVVSSPTDSSSVIHDKTPPRLPIVTIFSDNPRERYAKAGDAVTVEFTTDELLSYARPRVTIAGDTVKAHQIAEHRYRATRVLEAGETEGVVRFTIDYSDAAGNAGARITSVTDWSKVSFDSTTPTLTYVSISSDNERRGLAKPGNEVSIIFTVSEYLGLSFPTVTIDRRPASVGRSDRNVYRATRTLRKGDTEGAVSFAIDFTDLAGNTADQVTGVTDGTSVAYDKTPPLLPRVSILSSNERGGFARAGDAVTVEFTTDELLGDAWPQVTIAADTVKAHKIAENRYRATRVLHAGETEGVVSFAIDYSDAAGNTGVRITSVTDSSQVSFDSTTPMVTYVSISSDNERGGFARLGNEVSIVFAVDEYLGPSLPTVTIGRQPVSVSASKGNVYQAARTLQQGDTEGAVSFTVDFTDLAGNIGDQVTGVTDGTGVTYDKTPPILTHVSLYSDNVRSDYIRAGQHVALEFTVSEGLGEIPAVTIAGTPVKVGPAIAHNSYKALLRVSELPDGSQVPFSINFKDRAGQAGSPVTETTDGRTVWSDASFPIVVTTKMSSSNPENPAVARPGDILVLEFSVSEPLANRPRVLIAGKVPDQLYKTTETLYSAVAISRGSNSEGLIEFSIHIEDYVGRVAEVENLITAGDHVVHVPAKPLYVSAIVEEQVQAYVPDPAIIDLDEEEKIAIGHPVDGDHYGSAVQVIGRVADVESFKSLRYEVSPEVFIGQNSEFLFGDLEADEDGYFTFVFQTESLAGSQQIVITFETSDGESASTKIVVKEGDSAIPSFAVETDSSSVLLTWDHHPLAGRHDIRYGKADSESLELVENATSPFTIGDLETGNRYLFQVTATAKDGTGLGGSASKIIIPLGSGTLRPRVEGEYERIKVAWSKIEGASSFEIQRSLSPDEGYEIVSIIDAKLEFFDTDVRYGNEYFYRIKPSEIDTILSAAASGHALAFPTERIRVLKSWEDIAVAGATIFGDYAYVAAGEDGLVLFDISNPANPIAIGSIQTENAQAVAVTEEYAYVADGQRGLRVIDIDNPTKLVEVGARKSSDAQGIAVVGSATGEPRVYIADGTFGVKVFDVSNPRSPERLVSLQTADARDLAHARVDSRDYIIVADGPGGVLIIDGETPSPDVITTIETLAADAVHVSGEILFIADTNSGLIIADISIPLSPDVLSEYVVEHATDVSVTEDFAYVATVDQGLAIFDVRSPTLPVLYDTVAIENLAAVSSRGRRIFAGGKEGFFIFDSFFKGKSYEIASVVTGGKAYEITLSTVANGRSYAYVADRSDGLKIYDVSIPAALEPSSLVGHLQTDYCREIIVDSSLAYIADGPGGLIISDVSPAWDDNPDTQPVVLGQWDTDGHARGLSVQNTNVYLADGNRGIKVIDVQIPDKPTEVASLRTEYAVDVFSYGDYVYLADGDGGLKIIRADPNTFSIVAEVDTANTRDVSVRDGIAYVVSSAGLVILDVSSPENPVQLGHYQSGYAEEIAVQDRFAFVAEGFNGLTIIDVADPTDPYVVSRNDNRYAVGVAVSENYAYLVDSEGLKIIEIFIPVWALRS